jgi:hypothetical protein
MNSSSVFWLIPIAAISTGALIAVFSMWSRMRIREAQIRERIAMIEKGLVPPPEVDPAGFDRAMARYDRSEGYGQRRPEAARRAGIILIGIGLGLAVLIGLADYSATSFRTGLAVGGFVAILGLAFLVSSLVDRPRETPSPAPPPPLNK